jgi:hypothetical protein
VAFAARCARLVLPIFKSAWPEAPARHVAAIEAAVLAAERFGSGSSYVVRNAARAEAAAYAAARVAARVARAAAAAYAASAAGWASNSTVFENILADWAKIRAAAGGWTDDTPVPPSFFGPTDVRIEAHNTEGLASTRVLEIVLELSSDASDDEIASATAEVVGAADAVHRTHGGHGLRLDTLRVEQPIAAEVPA